MNMRVIIYNNDLSFYVEDKILEKILNFFKEDINVFI